MRYAIMVTGPAYGTQQASSALQFAHALLNEGHELASVFFYREGVYNANLLTSPASDEYDLVRAWQKLNTQHGVALNICVAAALRRGIIDETEAGRLALPSANLQPGFTLSGLGALAEASLTCDRVVQFLMKRIAFVFSTAPHGSASGREGLDALLATSALTEALGVFFISDGVFQLLPGQKPDAVLARDYIATFKLFDLYDIDQCWICAASLRERGLENINFVVDATPLEPVALRRELGNYDVILRF